MTNDTYNSNGGEFGGSSDYSRPETETYYETTSTSGVDAVFIGPADLAADMGHLGKQDHPDVIAAVCDTIQAVHDAGKKVGVNAFAPAQQEQYLAAGVDFIAVGADVQLLAQRSSQVVAQTRALGCPSRS